MASAGLSLLQEFTLWKASYAFVDGMYRPLAENETFTNAFRYGNWTITVPILLTQLAIAMGLKQQDVHRRSLRMAVPGVLMIWNNASPDGLTNPRTIHAGRPVQAGAKYVITKWYRTREWH